MAKKVLYREVNPIPSDYVAYYKFNNDITDETGNYDLTQTGSVAYVNDRFGHSEKALDFTTAAGSSNYLYSSTLKNVIGETINYTYSFWYTLASTANQTLLQTNTVKIIVTGGLLDINGVSFSTTLNKWTNIIISYEYIGAYNCPYKVYQNGDYKGTFTTDDASINNFNIGNYDNYSTPWLGYVDDWIVYDRILSDIEIKRINI